MRHVPWFTLAAAAVFLLSPYGQDLLYGAFLSNEQISNSISQFLLLVALAIVAGLALLEWTVKYFLRSRRAKIAGG